MEFLFWPRQVPRRPKTNKKAKIKRIYIKYFKIYGEIKQFCQI